MTSRGCEERKTVAVASSTTFVNDAQMDPRTNRIDSSVYSSYVIMKNHFLTRFQSWEINTSVFQWGYGVHESFTSVISRHRVFSTVVFKQNFLPWHPIETKTLPSRLLFDSIYEYLYFYFPTRSGCLEKYRCVFFLICRNWNAHRSKLPEVPNSHHQNKETNDRPNEPSMQWKGL